MSTQATEYVMDEAERAAQEAAREAEREEERFAARVAGYLLRASIFTLVVVGLAADAYHSGWELLWIAGITIAGSCVIDWLVEIVRKGPRG